MGYNGSGQFLINTTGNPVVTGTTISSTWANNLAQDLATGLSTAITKDGQTTVTNNIPLGGNKITGLANGTDPTDAAAYGQLSAFGVPGYTTTATAAGTTTLLVSSTTQQFFTGITTQTVVLPVTSTLVLGFQFVIVNNSTGVVTVNSSGANSVVAMVASSQVTLTCILTSGTTAASWNVEYTGIPSVTGTGANVLATSPTLVTPDLGTPASGALTNCTSIPGAQINANTVANSALAQMSAHTVKGNNGSSTANAGDLTIDQVCVQFTRPTKQIFTSGSGTYSLPANCLWIRVRMVGGAGGGASSGSGSTADGSAGGNTTFGSAFLVANAGGGGSRTTGTGATGGTASGGDINIAGADAASHNANSTDQPGTPGSVSPFGGFGAGGAGGTSPGNGLSATGYGSAGGGAGGSAAVDPAGGGAAGGYVEAIITSPSATYAYAVGAAGAGASAGTGGASGGNGKSGIIIVEEYYV